MTLQQSVQESHRLVPTIGSGSARRSSDIMGSSFALPRNHLPQGPSKKGKRQHRRLPRWGRIDDPSKAHN
jgi:hypothetical protein